MIAKVPPSGPLWTHEVKFDGYRVQLHLDGKHVALYSKNGNDFTSRYASVASAVAGLPTKAVILDAELTACAADGSPDFGALLRKRTTASASGCSTSLRRTEKTTGSFRSSCVARDSRD